MIDLEFYHTYKVENGKLEVCFELHPPETRYYDSETNTVESDIPDVWIPLKLPSSSGYLTELMHPSKYIGEGLYQFILDTYSGYVISLVEVAAECDQNEDYLELEFCDCDPAGWAILGKKVG